MATKKELKKLPGTSRGVRDNAAVRMLKLGRPICPNSKLKMIKDDDGKWVAAEEQLMNCQLMEKDDLPEGYGHWTEYCVAQGHDPYVTTRVWYEPVDLVEEDEDGNQVVVGTKRMKHTTKRPNIAQVSISIRHNSGRGAIYKMQVHGFKRLADIGFEEVCQFRNCQKPLDPKYSGTNFGSYCGYNHLALIGAAEESILLHYPDPKLNGQEHQKIKKAREKQLREVAASA